MTDWDRIFIVGPGLTLMQTKYFRKFINPVGAVGLVLICTTFNDSTDATMWRFRIGVILVLCALMAGPALSRIERVSEEEREAMRESLRSR